MPLPHNKLIGYWVEQLRAISFWMMGIIALIGLLGNSFKLVDADTEN